MENIKFMGIQVKNMAEALLLLGCDRENLNYNNKVVLVGGFTINVYTYSFNGNDNFYFSVSAVNFESNEHDI